MENIWENIQAGRVNFYQCPGRVGNTGYGWQLDKEGGGAIGCAFVLAPILVLLSIAHVAADQSPGPDVPHKSAVWFLSDKMDPPLP